MLSKILLLILGGSHAYVLNYLYHTSEIKQCTDHHAVACNPDLEVPCCNQSYECRVANWGDYTTPFLCLQKAHPKEYCQTHLDCFSLYNMFCNKDNECQCNNRMFPLNSTACAYFLGETCSNQAYCPTNALCIDNQCQCKPGFVQRSKKECVPTMLGKYCNKDDACQDLAHAECSEDHKCVCQKNRIEVNNAICVPLLNEFCWTDEKCAPDNSVCFLNKCQCELNYTSVSNYKCTRI